MSKGTPTNLFDFSKWFGNSGSWQNWGQSGPKSPSSTPPASSPASSGSVSGPTTTLTVTFNSEDAGYASAMGWYNARTGEAGILFKNTNDDGCNTGVKAGDTRSLTALQSDVDANNIGFFLIPNGANELSSSTLSSTMKFQVGSNGDGKIVIDRQYGSDVVLSGSEVLFSNQVHNKGDYDYVSGKVGTQGQNWSQKMGSQSDGADGILGTMAWDDQSMNGCGGTDRDFNDVVFTVTKSGGTNPPANGAPTDINLSSATISENVAGGVIGMLSTLDPNAGDKHSYSVSDGRFEVVDGQLKLKSGVSLDYETDSTVKLNITSKDQGGLGYTESFTVKVNDVNEAPANKAPTDISLSSATISENVAGGAIGMLSTVDPNAGDKHTYSVSDSRFEVVNGQLKLTAGTSLNYENGSSVQLTVTTKDQGGLSYSESFKIAVTNVNEAPTDISISNLSVDENASGAVVGNLSTVDPDAGNTHSYTVSDNRFEVVNGELKLIAGKSLDYETESSVQLNITTKDQGNLTHTESFTVKVNDVNEAPPNAAPTDIKLSGGVLTENVEGAVIGALSTEDPNVGDTHTYSISDDRFEIVGNQLQLKAGVGLNFEEESSFGITVTTTDKGGLSYSEDFTITVKDAAEAPVDIFLVPNTVEENASGAVIGTLIAIDEDGGDMHTYKVDDQRFEVAGDQLRLKAGSSLDYEAEPTVTVNVTATDLLGNSLTTEIVIDVQDVDEGVSAMAFGTGGIDTFLLDLAQEAVTTLVGFSRTNDRLSFSGVADANANGTIGLGDLFAMVSGVSDFGAGNDIVVDFTTGASLVLQGAGTGSVTSMSNLVSSPSAQYQFA